jgi:hypothetical protein
MSEQPGLEITDEYMQEMLQKTKPYSIVVLRKGPNYSSPDGPATVWEHGRRNFELRAAGSLAVVLPVGGDSDVRGVGIFTTDPDETRSIMEGDPAVRAGLLSYEVYPSRSFPGDALP